MRPIACTLTRMRKNSTTNQVRKLTKVPVEVVSGDTASCLECWWVPAVGIGFLIGLLLEVCD
jgi:hypothetical protein